MKPLERGTTRRGPQAGSAPLFSTATAQLVIEALRLYARMHVGEPASYKVERWDGKDAHVEEIVASASLILIGHAAFHAAVEQYPRLAAHLAAGGARNPEIP